MNLNELYSLVAYIFVYTNQEKADVVFVKNKLTERVKTKLR